MADNPQPADPLPVSLPVPVSLERHFDNRGIARAGDPVGGPDGADLDGVGHALPAAELPYAASTETGTGTRAGTGTAPSPEPGPGNGPEPGLVGGVPYLLGRPGAPDNVVAQGQRIELPDGRYHSALLLAAGSVAQPIGTGSSAAVSGTFTVEYVDGSSSVATLTAPGYLGPGGVIEAGYRYRSGGEIEAGATVSLWTLEVPLDALRTPVALVLPQSSAAAADEVVGGDSGRSKAASDGGPRLHVFALSLQPVVPGGAALVVRDVRCTSRMLGAATQTVEATVVNVGTQWLTEADQAAATVVLDMPGGRAVEPAIIRALAPGEQARIRIGLTADAENAAGGAECVGAVVRISRVDAPPLETGFRFTLGVPDYEPSTHSLRNHLAPYWFTGSKFGIFIHWGVYSVPAWAPVGEDYAEWYWARMNNPDKPTHRHHAETWGEDFAYDDFIPMFTADKYDPRDWAELFAAAGARYFVLTAKHHDGFALWDTGLSERSSVHLGPRRDLVRELLDAAAEHAPELYQGLYFSQPEFYNPDAPWLGRAPRNPYTGAPVPYTGYRAGKNYILDYQAGQTRELIETFDPDLIWYDISGAPNDTVHVAPSYYNQAKNRAQPKDVAVNSRGGIYAYDYRTPEYATFAATVPAAWEASRGLDPHSYGYNAATPFDAYLTTEDAVRQLVDIVSKNGNFLLDIGPRADGTIPEVMRDRLLEIGDWLKVNGEAIYDSTYWWRGAELGDLRFTIKPNEAFYIHALTEPGPRLVVDAPVPIREGDEVTLCGYAAPLAWSWTAREGEGRDGRALVIEVPQDAVAAGRHVWVFKVARAA